MTRASGDLRKPADSPSTYWGQECVVPVGTGGEIRCPAYPEPCSYIRVLDKVGTEIGYWTSVEVGEDPEDVMGAIMGAIKKAAADGPNDEQLAAIDAYAVRYGRYWKRLLADAWLDGSDASEPNGHLLRQVRNSFGPSWLKKYKRQ